MIKLVKIYLVIGVFALMLSITTVALAQTRVATGAATGRQIQAMANLKTKGDQEIDRRIASLTNVITRLSEAKRLNEDAKQRLIAQVQAEIASLTALRTKIDGDTDLATLRADVQSIVKSYRTYVVYIPQIHIIAAADRIISIADQITALTGRLQVNIDGARANGQDTAAMEAALIDLQAKVSDAKTQATAAQNEVIALTPNGYPANKATLQDARSKLRIAMQDLKAARQDIKTIQGLKGQKIPKPARSSTPSSSVVSP